MAKELCRLLTDCGRPFNRQFDLIAGVIASITARTPERSSSIVLQEQRSSAPVRVHDLKDLLAQHKTLQFWLRDQQGGWGFR